MHTDPAPELPKIIMLDLTEETKPFVESIDKLDDYGIGIDLPVAISEIIEILQREDDANYEMAYSGYELLPEGKTPMDEALRNYIELREMYAKAMFKHFQLFKLYLRGMLYYQFLDLNCGNLVLEKLGIPLTSHDRRNKTIERQVGLAYQRRLQATQASREELPEFLTNPRTSVR